MCVLGRRGVCYAASVEVDAEAVSFTPALPWDAQSGQPASNHFEQPLVGKSAPLGAHVETELVRKHVVVWTSFS